jgi:hypothetical protein
VEYFWAKYCKTIPHGQTWGKWTWCDPANLVKTECHFAGVDSAGRRWPLRVNKVTSIGGRSLDRLIRKVCEIKRRKPHDGSEAVIVYGQSNHALPSSVFTINRNLIPDKFRQCQILGDLAPEVRDHGSVSDGNWIIKPRISMGGRGIRRDDHECLNHGEYFQREFEKVREFRVHCFLWMNEPVQMIQEKIIDNKDQLTWNKKQGGKFRFAYQADLPDFENLEWSMPCALSTREMLTKVSVAALQRLRYDFGGIDIGMDKFGNLKIFEVNSRMGLLEQALFTYKRVFTALRILDINTYRERRWL